MIRLTVTGSVGAFDPAKVRYPLLEFLPCSSVDIELGPQLVIRVPGHSTHELVPGVLAAVEAVVGSSLAVDEEPD